MTASETEATPYAVVLNRDLMFGAGIRNALESQEMAAKFARDTTAFIELLESQPASPALRAGGSVADGRLWRQCGDPVTTLAVR